MKPGRIACCIPFCSRTASEERFRGEEIICGKCWKLVSAGIKAERSQLKRRARRVSRILMRRDVLRRNGITTKAARLEEMFFRAFGRNWERAKRSATDNKLGVGHACDERAVALHTGDDGSPSRDGKKGGSVFAGQENNRLDHGEA